MEFGRCLITGLLLGVPLTLASSPTEASTTIDRLPYVIKTSGHYSLAEDLKLDAPSGAAIRVDADHVTLDLNGHTLEGTAGSPSAAFGVQAVDRKNLTIANGTIRGFYFGIDIQSADRVDSRSTGHRVEELTLHRNWYFGIRLVGSNSTVSHCLVSSTGGSTRPRHTIPHGVRLVGERNVLRDCCIRDLHLKRCDAGRGEIVGVHFDAAKDSRMENNTLIDLTTETDDVISTDDQQERRFAVWINGGPRKDSFLTVRGNRFSGFTVPLAFTPGTDGQVEGNTFSGAADNPIRGKPAAQLDKNRIDESGAPVDCVER